MAYGFADIERLIDVAMATDEKLALLPGGDYFLDRPLRLDRRHSGLTLASRPGERAVLYGGQRLVDWEQRDDGTWAVPAPEGAQGLRMLLVNGRVAERSRLPESGYYLHDTLFTARWLSTHEGGWDRPPSDDELRTLIYRDGDLGEAFEPRDAELTVFHMWDESLVGVESIDPQTKTVRFSSDPGYPPGAFADQYDMPRRYVVWNLAEGLQHPGQWRHDRVAGEVIYKPRDGEDPATTVAIAPLLESVVVIESAAGEAVSGIQIRDLTIAVTNAPVMTGAFGAKRFDGAVSIRDADDCRLANLEIHGVGAHAIKATGDRLRVEDCQLHHTGASGLRYLGGGSTITGNHLHDVGLAFPSAIALYVGATDPNDTDEWRDAAASAGVTISRNTLHDTPYTAIAVGGAGHVIESNLIYRAMQDLYDGAGIYITFCDEIVVRGNFVRDIKESAGAGTSAYYLDELSKRCLVEGNLSIDVARPMHNHIASDNTIRDNVFVTPGEGRLTMERSDGYVLQNNVIVSPDGFALYDNSACDRIDGNTFVVNPDALLTHRLDRYEIVETRPLPLGERNTTDGRGVAVSRSGVVTVEPGSAASRLGVTPLDVSAAGAGGPDPTDS